MRVSICMPYYNRKKQLTHTLHSIEQSKHKNIEINIVDDCSDPGHDISLLGFYEKINLYHFQEAPSINPVKPFNKAISMATGDIIILQSPECYHVGDVVSKAVELLSKQSKEPLYIVFACYGLSLVQTKNLHCGHTSIPFSKQNVNDRNGRGDSWFEHSIYRPSMYHWCVALTKESMQILGGFDERYSNGIAYDDDEFLRRVKRAKMKIIQVESPLVYHQWHTKFITDPSFKLNEGLFISTVNEDIITVKNSFKPVKEWYLNVPKILHVYWGLYDVLPYVHYLTVASFLKMNPEWEVYLWSSKYPNQQKQWKTSEHRYQSKCKNFFQSLLKLKKVYHHIVDFENEELNSLPEILKSDYLRYQVLYDIGGVWSDMDILYFDTINNLEVNDPKNSKVETFVCYLQSLNIPLIGFLMASKGSFYFKHLKENCIIDKTSYQSIGSISCKILFPTLEDIPNAVDITTNSVYADIPNNEWMQSIYSNSFFKIKQGQIGLHWYAGNPLAGNFINSTNGGLENLPENILGTLIKNNWM